MSIRTADGEKVLTQWVELPSTGPIPGAYFRLYTETRLSELHSLANDNCSTAVYILYEYYRDKSKKSVEYKQWRNNAAELGFEKAVLDLRASEQSFNHPENYSWVSFIFSTIILVAICGLLLRVLIFQKHKNRKHP